MNMLDPKIYVTFKSLEDPKVEVGDWVDVVESASQLEQAINQIKEKSAIALDKDWQVRAFKNFGGCEQDILADSIKDLFVAAKLLRNYGWLGAKVIEKCFTGVPYAAGALKFFEACYLGAFSSVAEFAEQYPCENEKQLLQDYEIIKLEDNVLHVFDQRRFSGFYYYDEGYERYLFDEQD
jgi:hypothetical protein